LVRMFLFGEPADEPTARAALEAPPLEEWVAAGLLAAENGRFVAAVRVAPIDQLLLALDAPWRPEDPRRRVMWPAPSSSLLAQLTVGRPVRTMLDLGTGSGVQSLLACDHCERVTGTDYNPRALRFAAFNATLNGRSLELLEGDWLTPVAGRTFDLITA